MDKMEPCPNSPDGRCHVDTSMESGPNHCFYCEKPMPSRAQPADCEKVDDALNIYSLIGLLRREGIYSNLWCKDKLIMAADIIEQHVLRPHQVRPIREPAMTRPTQEDREAAADRLTPIQEGDPIWQTAQRIMAGQFDEHAWVQAAASARCQSEKIMAGLQEQILVSDPTPFRHDVELIRRPRIDEAAIRADERRKVIEECAKVAEAYRDPIMATDHENRCFKDIASAIRGLAGDHG